MSLCYFRLTRKETTGKQDSQQLVNFNPLRNIAVFKLFVLYMYVDTIDMVEGVCNSFLHYTRFLGFPEFSGYHQWQQESQ